METSRSRDRAVDALKGIGIIFVVAGHYNLHSDYQSWYDWIWSFHMPLFFMAGGYLFALNSDNLTKHGFLKYLLKQVRKLLLPYCVFFVINFIFFYRQEIYHETLTIPAEEQLKLLQAFILGGGYLNPDRFCAMVFSALFYIHAFVLLDQPISQKLKCQECQNMDDSAVFINGCLHTADPASASGPAGISYKRLAGRNIVYVNRLLISHIH